MRKTTKSKPAQKPRNKKYIEAYDILYEKVMSLMSEYSEPAKGDESGLKRICELIEKIQRGQRLAENGADTGPGVDSIEKLQAIFQSITEEINESEQE